MSATRTRVVLNGRFLSQPNTGVQRYARETLLALDALLSQTTTASDLEFVLCVPGKADRMPLQRIRTHKLPWLSGHAWEQITLPIYAGTDLLVSPSYSGPVMKRRQIVTIHDATVAAVPACFSAKYRFVHRLLIALLGNRVASVMTVSEFSAAEIRQRYGIANRVVVGREGWSHSVAHGDEAAVLGRYNLASRNYLLLVGSIKPNKNLAVVGRALALMSECPWTVAVAGARDSRIFQDAPENSGRMNYLGFVPDADLGVLYKHAAWFVFPSMYEGFGLPALEAMANGCPVIAARSTSLPEVCGDAAIYFGPDDAQGLATLLQDLPGRDDLRADLQAKAAARLDHYTWNANARILLDEIVECLGRGVRQTTEAETGVRQPT
jgi:glycosyltransferase involved in cell wall biosynthesis